MTDIHKDYAALFATPQGQAVLQDLEDQFFNRTSLVRGDPYMTHANEGAREVVLYIKHMTEERDVRKPTR